MIEDPSFLVFCNEFKGQVTSLRKNVLYLLWKAQKPLKAYEILDQLLRVQSNATATSVYRALDFWVNSSVVHKLDSLQSYAVCTELHSHHHAEVMLICRQCHTLTEAHFHPLSHSLEQLTHQYAFHWEASTIELKGICQTCSKKGA